MQAYWEGLDNVENIRCTRSTVRTDNSATYKVEFLEWPAWPIQNKRVQPAATRR